MTEAGRAAADYRSGVAAEASRATSEIWTCYFTLLAASSLTPDQSDQLLSLAKELDRLPEVDADAS